MSHSKEAAAGLTDRILNAMGMAPTPGQSTAIDAMERLLATDKPQATLVLRGYAGTGKTTLVGALVKALARERHPVVLLAPTGRAAKVLAAHARLPASTIHRRIYRVGGDEGEGWGLTLTHNRDRGALFIVDEASMIGSAGPEASFGERDLLQDLLEYIFSGEGNKLLLVGDPAQLPPVGAEHSPALFAKDLRDRGLTAGMVELTEVVRQAEASGILKHATDLRALLVPPEAALSEPATVSEAKRPS